MPRNTAQQQQDRLRLSTDRELTHPRISPVAAKGSKKTNKDQKTKSRDQKKQIRIKKTNKDDRSENRQETAEREDQKKKWEYI